MSQKSKDASTGSCIETECKSKQDRLGFCTEHFEQFKFGCIRKDGLRPTDYEKKYSHYVRHKEQVRARSK